MAKIIRRAIPIGAIDEFITPPPGITVLVTRMFSGCAGRKDGCFIFVNDPST